MYYFSKYDISLAKTMIIYLFESVPVKQNSHSHIENGCFIGIYFGCYIEIQICSFEPRS